MFGLWRPRLFHIKDEEELRKYFEENARYNEQEDIYVCAGIVSDDTIKLYQKLKKAWKDDIAFEAEKVSENKA
jgi:hypothetical protein